MLLVWKVLEEDEVDLFKNNSHEVACGPMLTDPMMNLTVGWT